MFDAFIAFQARARPRTLALISPSGAQTYAELNDDVNRYAAALAARGVTPETGVVSVQVARRHRHYALILALARLGVATTASSDLAADLRITDKLGETGPGILNLSAEWMATTEAAPPTEVASAPRDPEALGRVTLSSGSTGQPKRVPVSWRRLEIGAYNALAVYLADKMGIWILRTGLDSSLGFSLAAAAWSMGATVAADFPVAEIPELMEAHEAGVVVLSTLHLRHLLRALPPGYAQQPGFRMIVTGDLLPPALAREALLRLTPDIHVDYGSSETGRALVGPAQRLESTPGAVGWPVPGVTAEVVGPDDTPLPDGEQGQLRIRGDRNAREYLGDPEATARVFRDGWVYPGDLARRLPDGLIVVDGRADERMSVEGLKLLPETLENAALDHPGVIDAAAFALPNKAGIDECWVAVVAGEGLDRDALARRLRQAAPGLPGLRFAWTESIPRNAMGKIERATLRAQTAKALGS